MIQRIKRLKADKPRLYQMGTYLFYGLLTTLVNWASYLLLTQVLGIRLYEQNSPAYKLIANISQVISWLVSVLFAYFTNRRFVFKSTTRRKLMLREMWQFVSARALSYLMFDLLLFNLLLLFMTDRWAKLIVNGFVIVFNYLASRFVIFRSGRMEGKNDKAEDQAQ